MAPTKSILWRYFNKKDHRSAICKSCSCTLKTAGNTLNLKCHLKSRHLEIYKLIYCNNLREDETDAESAECSSGQSSSQTLSIRDAEPSAKQCKSSNNPTNVLPPTDKNVNLSSASTVSMTSDTEESKFENLKQNQSNRAVTTFQPQLNIQRQPTIDGSFSILKSWEKGGAKFRKLTASIMYMICKDYQPFSVVENKGFEHLLKIAAPHYVIPSRRTISRQLDLKYESISNLYKLKIQKLLSYTLTTDLQSRSFLGITLHFAEKEKMNSIDLGVYDLNERHTAEYISQILLQTCEEWNVVPNKITNIVTDGAANITKAIELAYGKEKHIHCFAHQLNLIAERAIKSVDNLCIIISKVKSIATWFKQSVIASDDLRISQHPNEPKKLIQEVATRWNSLYYMIERFLELREVVNSIVNRHPTAPIMVSAMDIEELTKAMDFLRPLEAATVDLCGEKYTTCSRVIPVTYNLEKAISQVMIPDTLHVSVSLKSALLRECNKRFGAVEQVQLLASATIVDPRFKKIYFKNPIHVAKAVQFIEGQLHQNQGRIICDESDENLSSRASQHNDSNKFSLWEDHNKLVNENLLQEGGSLSELSQYLKNPVVKNLNENPLKWWINSNSAFPSLTPIAIKLLSTVATSAPTERLFSKAGQTLTQERNRIKGKRLSKLLFMHSLDEQYCGTYKF